MPAYLTLGILPQHLLSQIPASDLYDTPFNARPVGSGPYRVEALDPGRSITYRRVKDYWGAKLPVNVGRDNFDSLRYDYYRDSTVAIEALKGGEYDFRVENVAKNWATAYATPAVTRGVLKKEEIPNEVPTGMAAALDLEVVEEGAVAS